MSQPLPPPGEPDPNRAPGDRPPPPPTFPGAPPPPPPGPYGQGPYGQNPYGQSAYRTAARDHPQGTTILVLGILSLVICGLLGPVAWAMGSSAINEIDANPAAYTNRGTVRAGQICGIVATALLALGIIVLIAAAAATSSSNG